jgi:penicillin-binding protein 2
MPSILKVEQFIADSVRAVQWFKMTNDSNYIRKYIKPRTPVKNDSSSDKEQRVVLLPSQDALAPKELFSFKKKMSAA